jgi:hypothetical protein
VSFTKLYGHADESQQVIGVQIEASTHFGSGHAGYFYDGCRGICATKKRHPSASDQSTNIPYPNAIHIRRLYFDDLSSPRTIQDVGERRSGAPDNGRRPGKHSKLVVNAVRCGIDNLEALFGQCSFDHRLAQKVTFFYRPASNITCLRTCGDFSHELIGDL